MKIKILGTRGEIEETAPWHTKHSGVLMATLETTNTASQRLFEKFGFSIDSRAFKGNEQELIQENDREAVKNYYNSGTYKVFYVKKI